MDQHLANQLFRDGAVLYFLDVPPGTEFGIDYYSWEIGPKFRGVKMIPPGVHFVYYSAVSKERDVAPRTGFFYNFRAKEVLVKRWDPTTEDISTEEISADEQDRLEINKQENDRYLGPYPYDSYRKWISLTNHMRPELVERLLPANHKICAVTQFKANPSTTQSRREAREAEMASGEQPSERDGLPDMEIQAGTQIQFTNIPKQTYPEGASPQEVTKYSMDHSFILESLLQTAYSENSLDILGELQFAFICFIVGQVFDAFDQWKNLMRTLCTSDEALANQSELYSQFISMMHYQVTEIPEDFFVDIVSQNNFLVTVLHALFVNLEGSATTAELKRKGNRFRKNLQRKFKWDFSFEADEDCPLVVE